MKKIIEPNYTILNQKISETEGDCEIDNCLGQRFIAAGMTAKKIVINGIPGNALGAYLAGAQIIVNGNAQDAVGDTMNSGEIIIHGHAGDAVGYAMRGGAIYIRGNVGYRCGVHLKEYQGKKPVIVIGGSTGSFLGEYQAGGLIIVLGNNKGNKPTVSNFPCTGMHGGKVFLRGDTSNIVFPKQVNTKIATTEEIKEITPYVNRFATLFGYEVEAILKEQFTVITPDSKNPYKQMYVMN